MSKKSRNARSGKGLGHGLDSLFKIDSIDIDSIYIRLDSEVKEQLDEYTETHMVEPSGLINDLLSEYFAKISKS